MCHCGREKVMLLLPRSLMTSFVKWLDNLADRTEAYMA